MFSDTIATDACKPTILCISADQINTLIEMLMLENESYQNLQISPVSPRLHEANPV
jgi:hypothetical protein